MQEKITYTIKDSILGSILVAQSEKGICAVHMDDCASTLLKTFQIRFPEASFTDLDRKRNKRANNIIKFIEQPHGGLNVLLDMRGTEFQKKVWSAIREIPSGETASYIDLAKRLKQPKAVRAVARACAMNPLAVVVPCHRIIKNDGTLSGYRWGVERKQQLLELEGARL